MTQYLAQVYIVISIINDIILNYSQFTVFTILIKFINWTISISFPMDNPYDFAPQPKKKKKSGKCDPISLIK